MSKTIRAHTVKYYASIKSFLKWHRNTVLSLEKFNYTSVDLNVWRTKNIFCEPSKYFRISNVLKIKRKISPVMWKIQVGSVYHNYRLILSVEKLKQTEQIIAALLNICVLKLFPPSHLSHLERRLPFKFTLSENSLHMQQLSVL